MTRLRKRLWHLGRTLRNERGWLGGPESGQSLADWITEKATPSLAGGGLPATPQAMDLPEANYGQQLFKNGSFESWSSGTTSAPDGYTLTGAGATIARNTTNVQHGLASVDVSAALNTATDLAQSLTISSTQNTFLRGAVVRASVYVRVGSADRAFLRIDDGVGTTDSIFEIVGDSTFRRLTVTRRLSSSATKLEVSCEIASGAALTATFDALIISLGEAIVNFSPHPSDPFFQPRKLRDQNTKTTTSTAVEDITGMSIANVILDGNQSVCVGYSIRTAKVNVAGESLGVQVARGDNTTIEGTEWSRDFADATDEETANGFGIDNKPAAGNYTYKLRWNITGASTTGSGGAFDMYLFVIPAA